jgi:glycosyltransferase involved in cell wall biosynthesis
MSILIFQPSVAPHVQQAARALMEAGQLDRFVTSVRDDPESLFQRSVVGLGRVLGRDWAAQFRRRAVTEIPRERVESHPFGEWLRIGAAAADRSGWLADVVWGWSEPSFDRRVSRGLGGAVSGVYGFENSSLATFRRARELGLKVVYEVPAPEPGFVHRLLDAEIERFPEFGSATHHRAAKHLEERTARRREEWELADLVMVNSRFTRESYALAGLDCAKVRTLPLGAPPPAMPEDAPGPDGPGLTLIWAGTFGIRKGAHYLLDAWRRGKFGKSARLLVYGSVALPERALRPLPEGVEFRGSIPRAQLFGEYPAADALIFPTLCDGFGMVATEAWAHGVPVITTDRAGVSDMLRPMENGLLVKAGDSGALRETIGWCITHRAELRAMRRASRETAARWQWSDYRRTHAEVLRTAGIFGGAP